MVQSYQHPDARSYSDLIRHALRDAAHGKHITWRAGYLSPSWQTILEDASIRPGVSIHDPIIWFPSGGTITRHWDEGAPPW